MAKSQDFLPGTEGSVADTAIPNYS